MGLLRFVICAASFAGFIARGADPLAFVISDNATGYVLQSANPTKKLQIGSLTKIATAMVVSGGVIVVAGVVWSLALNRPRRVVPALDVQPTSDGVAVKAAWQF